MVGLIIITLRTMYMYMLLWSRVSHWQSVHPVNLSNV